jgi:hypothetical protein
MQITADLQASKEVLIVIERFSDLFLSLGAGGLPGEKDPTKFRLVYLMYR